MRCSPYVNSKPRAEPVLTSRSSSTAVHLSTRHRLSTSSCCPRRSTTRQNKKLQTSKMSDVSTARLDALVQEGIVWASQHGLVVGLGAPSCPPVALIHAPLSLLPVAFPQERFNQAKAAMTSFNTLIDKVASDEAYLATTLSKAAQHDVFTGRLLALMHTSAPARTAAAGAAHPGVVLGVHRSDYMLDAPSGGFLQVELNTIASSFGCLSTLTTQLHTYTLARLAAAAAAAAAAEEEGPSSQPPQQQQQQLQQLLNPQRLPSNEAMVGISKALAAATAAAGGQGAVMVIIVQPGERNAYDQQWLQQTLWEQHGVVTHRLSLGGVEQALELRPVQQQQQQQQQQLVLKATGQVVGCVYFRAGYTPNDYPTEKEWQARAFIESSTACKCPNVTYQLAGSKKVQQDLARPGVVERFIGEKEGKALRQLFAGLWSLDNPSDPHTAAVIQDAIQNPDRYVLKPQREGGGNNLYGQDLVIMLQKGLEAGSGEGSGLAAFILMQRILPPPQRSVFVRGGEWMEDESLSELGIYGTFLKVGEKVTLNEEVGHLVRTKTSSSNEGGVAAGFAVLDSPLLSEPGEGLLHPDVETAAAAAAAGGEGSTSGGGSSSENQWGAAGGVLAVAKALLS